MKKMLKEITVLVVLPLILMSVTLASLGPTHTINVVNTNRVLKLRESSNAPVYCDDTLCNDLKNLEHTLIELEKTISV